MADVVKLDIAKLILEKVLGSTLKILNYEPKLARIYILLRDSVQLFIRYNNHEEYSYNIFFSNSELDRCRFDNYDDKWNVATSPHHFHPRFEENGYNSPMNGNPNNDLQILFNLIKSGKLLNKSIRF